MIKDIAYSGLSATPSDYNSPDGALAAAFNLIPENGALSPVAPPTLLYRVPKPYRPLLIHKIPGGQTHYIFVGLDDDKIHTNISYATADELDSGDWAGLPHWICQVSGNVTTHAILGNVIAIASDNAPMSFLWWKGNSYTLMPGNLPDIHMQFSFFLDNRQRLHNAGFDVALSTETGSYDENCKAAADACFGALNKLRADLHADGLFTDPFYIRYALRLFDGSFVYPSAPVLVSPSRAIDSVSISGEGQYNDDKFSFYVNQYAGQLMFQPFFDEAANDLQKWDDIIESVAIFVSAPIITCDFNKVSAHCSGASGRPTATVSLIKKPVDVASCASNFYLLRTVRWAKVRTLTKAVAAIESGKELPDVYGLPLLDGEGAYSFPDRFLPENLFSYNSRLCATAITRLFSSASPFSNMFSRQMVAEGYTTDTQVSIKVDAYCLRQGIWYRRSSIESMLAIAVSNCPSWLYIADSNAKYLRVDLGGTKFYFSLSPHDFLPGAYIYLSSSNLYLDWSTCDGANNQEAKKQIDNLEADNGAILHDRFDEVGSIFMTEVNNPFFFVPKYTVNVSSGTVMAISSAAKALSQGQFGQFPLYAFTSEGVWALELTSTGTFAARQPITRDVCVCPEGITQIDSAVLFPTSRGIMLLEGSKATPISDPLFAASFSPQTLPSISALLSGSGIDISQVNPMQFPQFISRCRMAYDYPRQRIIVYRPDSPMAYLFSLKSKAWGAMQSSLSYTLNSYPDALAVDTDGNILNLSDAPDSAGAEVPTLLLSRPLKLDNPDILKTVDTVLQRGYFRKDHIRSMLYGSRDLFSWHCIASSVDHNLRGFRGSPYKYFRILLTASLSPDESISGATIRFTSRYTNRPR